MRILPLLLSCVTAAMLSACAVLSPLPASGTFLEREVVVDGATHRYQVFVPARSAVSGKPPVILFLHGSGERGNDNRKQVAVGLGPYVRANANTFPAIVVFPQAPEGSEWDQVADVAFAQLDATTQEFRGDVDRTILTGLSMGGYGTWELALREPARFAALVPVCGGITPPAHRPSLAATTVAGASDPFDAAATRLRAVPIWIFHGARDDLVLPEQSRRMHAALLAHDAVDARYTEFPNANHNSWDPAYAQTPELWEWVFEQRR